MARYPSTVCAVWAVVTGWTAGLSLWFAVALLVASCVSGAAGVSGGARSDARPSSAAGASSDVHRVDTHAWMEYTSVDVLFPGLGEASTAAAATSPAPPTTHHLDGGTFEYAYAKDVLAGKTVNAAPAGAFDPSTMRVPGGGWPNAGPGRLEGSGLRLSDSLGDVLVVMFATMAYQSLTKRFDSSDDTMKALSGLRALRRRYKRITYAALRNRVWDLAPSGAIGVVVKFGGTGSRDNKGKHQVLVATASLAGEDVVCSCSEEERCLGPSGCSLRIPMVAALEKVRVAMEVNMADFFMVLRASVKVGRLRAGRAVLYGDRTCVVRNGDTSWPFTAVRRTRGGSWVCLACRTADGTCDHVHSAVSAAREDAEGEGSDSSDSDVDEDEGDEAGLLVAAGLADAGDPVVAGAVQLPAHLLSNTTPLAPVNRFKWAPRSAESRHLVPPLVAQRERAAMMRALRNPALKMHYKAGAQCPYCLVGRSCKTEIEVKNAKVEFEDGAVPATVETWRCHQCLFRVLPDGAARGVIFHSCHTIYSEAFLFEVAVNLARNGSSLHSASYLREAFSELHHGSKYPGANKRMRSVSTLRKALLLYLALAIKGLPYDTVSCATCRRPDGSYVVVSFDGLQLGYRVKYKKAFDRTEVKIHPVKRASIVPCLITDEAVSKAIGRVLTTKKKGGAAPSTKAITTVTSMRGHIMAVALLLGNVMVGGVEKSFAGSKGHLEDGVKNRGWDPMVDGGASKELVAFLRGAFDVRVAARSLALTVEGAPADLRRRVPAELMARVHALLVDAELPLAPAGPTEPAAHGGGESLLVDTDLLRVDAERGRMRARADDWGEADQGSSTDGASSSDSDPFASDEDGYVLPRAAEEPAEMEWDRDAPLLAYGEALDEPALGTTGGEAGAARLRNMSLPLLPHIPCTAASTLKILDFVRAVVVDPTFVWAPQKSWAAVDAVVDVLLSSEFSIPSLAATLSLPLVKEQRLLRGAVACFGPGLESDARLRRLLAGLLSGLKERAAAYDKWVGDSAETVALHPSAVNSLRFEMAAAHPSYTFSHKQFTHAWLLPPATVAGYRAVYNEYTDQWDDYLRTGIWAPGLPVLRPMPGFRGASSASTDLPTCKHEMGKETSHTSGTIGVFCTCSHPKCIGVLVLTGSESQRMPLEFVAQRFVQMPKTIIYDFACATLKTALVRLPFLARVLSLKCDRFHWRENHVDCSAAMNPDSYVSLDGVNTSSCEERNALSRRQQHHLRQMQQDQFITFTVYQQAVSNAVAMHRDNKMMGESCKWPEWYRRTHVDVDGAPRESE